MFDNFLSRNWKVFSIATFLSVLLGLSSTILSGFIGPALQSIGADRQDLLSFENLFGPYISSFISLFVSFDKVRVGELWRFLPVAIVVLAGVRAVLTVSTWLIWESFSESYAAKLRKRLASSFLELDPASFFADRREDEKITALLTTDIKLYREYIVHFYGGLPRELIQTVMYFVGAIALSPKLFAIFIIGLLPAAIVLGKLGKKIRKRFGAALQGYSELSEWLQQRLLGIETIKQMGTEARENLGFQEKTASLSKQYLHTVRVKARTSPVLEFIAVLFLSTIIAVSLAMIKRGEVSGAIMMSFFTLLALAIQSAGKLGRYYNSNKEGGAALERLTHFDSYLQENRWEGPSFKVSKTVEEDTIISLQKLTVSYPGTKEAALSEVSCTFRKGRIYSIVGPSGSGKSTLILSLLGILSVQSGELLVKDGLTAKDIGYLPQSVKLAELSLAELVAYPESSFSMHKLKLSLGKVGLDQSLSEKDLLEPSHQYESKLSGGQRQRLLLARVFYHDFKLVIIDEATSAVDVENEKLILDSLRELTKKGTCVVMIAHRQAVIDLSDEIIHLENGRRQKPANPL